MENNWKRLEHLLGYGNIEKLENKKIMVIGLGGVGGYVVEGLIRCKVEHLTVVDPDRVENTNINRQIIALQSTIGKLKCSLVKERCLDINPKAQIEEFPIFVDENNIEELVTEEYDYIIDACDTLKTKKLLIDICFLKNIPLISCMGTARKIEPQKLEVIDITKTSYDPLAKGIRQYMRANYPSKKLKVLSSKEKPQKLIDNTLASSIFVPATAGLLIADYVIKELFKQ